MYHPVTGTRQVFIRSSILDLRLLYKYWLILRAFTYRKNVGRPDEMYTSSSTDQLDLSWSIPLSIDTDEDQYLRHSTVQENKPEEEFFPREVIAEAVGSSRLQAELGRPILIDTWKGLPAVLLRPHFSFQCLSSSSLCRI